MGASERGPSLYLNYCISHCWMSLYYTYIHIWEKEILFVLSSKQVRLFKYTHTVYKYIYGGSNVVEDMELLYLIICDEEIRLFPSEPRRLCLKSISSPFQGSLDLVSCCIMCVKFSIVPQWFPFLQFLDCYPIFVISPPSLRPKISVWTHFIPKQETSQNCIWVLLKFHCLCSTKSQCIPVVDVHVTVLYSFACVLNE